MNWRTTLIGATCFIGPEQPFKNAKTDNCKLQWQGDGECDDVNNTPECDYDGGDCCKYDKNTKYCSDCHCHGCGSPSLQGDGKCNAENNNIALFDLASFSFFANDM